MPQPFILIQWPSLAMQCLACMCLKIWMLINFLQFFRLVLFESMSRQFHYSERKHYEKRNIAGYPVFSPFQKKFQKSYFHRVIKTQVLWKANSWTVSVPLNLYHTIQTFNDPDEEDFCKQICKSLFPQCFLPCHRQISSVEPHYIFSPAKTFSMEVSEMLINPLPDDKILDWSKLKQIADTVLECI